MTVSLAIRLSEDEEEPVDSSVGGVMGRTGRGDLSARPRSPSAEGGCDRRSSSIVDLRLRLVLLSSAASPPEIAALLLFDRRLILGISDASTDVLVTDDGVDAIDVGVPCTNDASMLYAGVVGSGSLSVSCGVRAIGCCEDIRVPRVDGNVITSGSSEDATTY